MIGMQCPECGQRERFTVTTHCDVVVEPLADRSSVDGSPDWGGDNSASCAKCGYDDIVETFETVSSLATECLEDFGAFRDGWTPADIDRVLPPWSKLLQCEIVAVWAKHDAHGFAGDSDLVVVSTLSDRPRQMWQVPKRLWDFLNGLPDDADRERREALLEGVIRAARKRLRLHDEKPPKAWPVSEGRNVAWKAR